MVGKVRNLKLQQRLALGEIRKQAYEYHRFHDRGFYTTFKAKLYMELASLLVYFLQDKKVHPTVLTTIYGLLGMAGGVLLAVGSFMAVLLAVCIFFFKGVVDWADGPLARMNNQESVIGGMLDYYAGTIGTLAFYTGLCFFLYGKVPFLHLISVPILCSLKILNGRAKVIDSICLLLLIYVIA